MTNWELGHARFLVVTFFLDIIIVSKLSTNSAYKRQKNQTSNYQHLLDHRESKGILGKKKQNKTISASLTMLKLLSVLITTSYGKHLKKWEYQTTLPVSWEICMKAKNEQLDLYMEQLTGSKLGKGSNKAVYCHAVYLTYLQCASWEMPGWMNHRLESRLSEEISTTLYM